jgi:hypothetical protein
MRVPSLFGILMDMHISREVGLVVRLPVRAK